MHKISQLASRVSQGCQLTHVIIALRRIRSSRPTWLVWWVQVMWAVWELLQITHEELIMKMYLSRRHMLFTLSTPCKHHIGSFDQFNEAIKMNINLKKRKNKTILLKINIIYIIYLKYLLKNILDLSLVRLQPTMSVYKKSYQYILAKIFLSHMQSIWKTYLNMNKCE